MLSSQESDSLLGNLIVGVLVVVALPIVLAWIQASTRQEPRTAKGATVLEHSLRFKAICWTGCLIFGCALGFIVHGALKGEWSWASVLPLSGFFLGSAAFFLETRSFATLDEEGIRDYKVWRGHRSMRWSEVASIRHGSVNDWLMIKDRQGKSYG